MKLAKVIGNVTLTHKIDGLEGLKFLLIQSIDDKKIIKDIAIAIDNVHAGIGDIVFYITAKEASLVIANSFIPVDMAIIGIIDNVNVM